MKPIQLKFKGIGSYFGENEVDFSSLDSIFLICGETGAGKTTILDAIMFALYDESSGGERVSLLNSHYSKKDGAAFSIFTFDLGNRLYRFSRLYSPRPRADGFETSQNCEYYNDGVWLPFFDNPTAGAVNKKACELLGLSAEQFRQVIILPQGRFEKFLTGSSEDKESILKTLFGAERFTRISDNLRADALEEKRRLEHERELQSAALAAEGFSCPDEADAFAAELKEKIDEYRKQYEAAANEKQIAEKAVSDGAVLASLYDKLDKANSDKKRLLAQRGSFDRLNETIDRLKREMNVFAVYKDHCAAKEEKLRREAQLKKAEDILSDAEDKLNTAQQELDKIKLQEHDIEKKRADIIRLNELIGIYTQAEPLKSEVRSLEEAENELDKSINKSDISLSKLQTKASELNDLAEKMRQNGSKAIAFLEQLNRLQAGREKSEELEKLRKKISELDKSFLSEQKKLDEMLEKEKNKRLEYNEIKEKYYSSISARLAADLREGMPCPVCGSTHHETVHGKAQDNVDENMLERASSELESTIEEKNKIAAGLSSITEKLSEYKETAEKLLKFIDECGYSEENYIKVKSEYDFAKKCSEQCEGINSDIKKLNDDIRSKDNEKNELIKKLDSLRSERIAKSAEYKLLCSQMDKNIHDINSLQLMISKTNSAVKSYDEGIRDINEQLDNCSRKLSAASGARLTAENEYKEAAEKFEVLHDKTEMLLAENLLPSAELYEPDEDGINKLPQYIEKSKEYDAEVTSADRSCEMFTEEIAGRERPDIELIKKKYSEIDRKCSELLHEISSCEEKKDRISELAAASRSKDLVLKNEEAANARQTAFAEEMSGSRGISFTRYVLGVMLDMVIDEANCILSEMLGGTFRLVRQQKMKANKKQGLDLLVENTLAGNSASYAAAQLSGGEKFLISLVMGVALSTVVQSRFGGISIDAMFIDEGFGSLDPAALKDAVNMIFEISASGRTIGIISHVEKLREEIPCCINVSKDRNGSRIVY